MSDHNTQWPPDHAEISRLAYQNWERRGCEHGCSEEDWYQAEKELWARRPDLSPHSSAGRTAIGVFQNLNDAERAIDDLQREGIPREQISCIASDRVTGGQPEGGVLEDAGIGAALGGLGGLMLGFATLAAPGVGTILAAGPILAALGGAGLGAAAGGLAGALTESGVSDEQARRYAEVVRRGDILVSVQANGELADRAAQIMDRNGAVNIAEKGDQAPNEAELRREREYDAAAQEQGDEWSRLGHVGSPAGAYERES